MADTTAAAATSSLSAQEQARIRRERRQAKMREGGSVRLNRITATQGTSFRRDGERTHLIPPLPPSPGGEGHTLTICFPEPEATPPPAPTVEGEGESHSDPPEVDISLTRPTLSSRPSILQQHAAAHFSSTVSPEDDIRQAMMLDQLYRPRGSSSSSPSGTPSLDEGQDPLMQLLQQISGAGGGLGGMPGMPPGMESMMSGMMGGIGEGVQAAEQKADRSGVWWSILHALGALMISFWTLRASPVVFDGSQLARTESAGLTRSEKPV